MINFKYYRLRILLHILGISKSGKSTFNDFINKFVNTNYVAGLKFKADNSFNFNSIKPITQIFQFADTKNSGNFKEDLKQLNGESEIVWEGKHQAQRMIPNNGLIKFISNDGNDYPAVLKDNWFYDKIVKIEFLATYSDKEKKILDKKYGDKDKMFEKLKDIFATYFIKTCNDFFENPVRYLTDYNLKNEDPDEFYCQLFLKMINNEQLIKFKTLVEKEKGSELSAITTLFKKYCTIKNKNVDEINTKNLKAILNKSGIFCFIYSKSRKNQPGRYKIIYRSNLISIHPQAYQNLNSINEAIMNAAEFEELDDYRIEELFGETNITKEEENEQLVDKSALTPRELTTSLNFSYAPLNSSITVQCNSESTKENEENGVFTQHSSNDKKQVYLNKINNLIVKYPNNNLFTALKDKLLNEDTDDKYLEFVYLEIDKHN